MDFGLFVACHRLSDSVDPRDVYERALETVELAEEAGFSVAWFPEHHLIQFMCCPSPLMFAVRAAERTRRIRVGTANVTVPYYHPVRLAGEIGLADVFTGGRLEVGVARGAFEYELRTFGMATEQTAAARFREGMEVLHGLLTSEDFTFSGPTWTLPPTTSLPRPIQKPCPPIWVASRSADTIRWAVEKGF